MSSAVAGYEHSSAQKTNIFQTVWKSNSVLLILNALREEWARLEAGVKTQQQLVVPETVQLFISLYWGIFLAWRLSFLQEDRKRIRRWKTNNIWPNLPEERPVQRVGVEWASSGARLCRNRLPDIIYGESKQVQEKKISLFVRAYKRVPTAFRKKYPNKHINTSCLGYCVNAESAFTPLFFCSEFLPCFLLSSYVCILCATITTRRSVQLQLEMYLKTFDIWKF